MGNTTHLRVLPRAVPAPVAASVKQSPHQFAQKLLRSAAKRTGWLAGLPWRGIRRGAAFLGRGLCRMSGVPHGAGRWVGRLAGRAAQAGARCWAGSVGRVVAALGRVGGKIAHSRGGGVAEAAPGQALRLVDADGHVHGLAGLSEIMERAKAAAERAVRLFPVVTGLVFCLTSLLVAMGVVAGGVLLFPACPPLFPLLIALLPAALLAGAMAHGAGNILLRRVTGFNQAERRSLALHLPWNRAPEAWPGYFRRWIYCGDWLVENFSGDLMPYVRAFVTGEIPQSIEEELELWCCLMQNSRQRRDFEVGHSVRELACVDALPGWTREITPGMNLPELERALGEAGRSWAVSLLKRAATRKRIFAVVNYLGDLSEVLFEFHYSRLPGGREGLMVVIRPHLPNRVQILEDSYSDVA